MKNKKMLLMPLAALLALVGCKDSGNSSSKSVDNSSVSNSNSSSIISDSNSNSSSTVITPDPDLPSSIDDVYELLETVEEMRGLANHVYLSQPSYFDSILEMNFYDDNSYDAKTSLFGEDAAMVYFGPLQGVENKVVEVMSMEGEVEAYTKTIGTDEQASVDPDTYITMGDIEWLMGSFLVSGNDDFSGVMMDIMMGDEFNDEEDLWVKPWKVSSSINEETKNLVVQLNGGYYDITFDENYEDIDGFYSKTLTLIVDEESFLLSAKLESVVYKASDFDETTLEIKEDATVLEEVLDYEAIATKGEKLDATKGHLLYDPFKENHLIPQTATIKVGKDDAAGNLVETTTFDLNDTFAFEIEGLNETTIETMRMSSSNRAVINGSGTINGVGTATLTFNSAYVEFEVEITVTKSLEFSVEYLSDGGANLTWDAVDGATNYDIYVVFEGSEKEHQTNVTTNTYKLHSIFFSSWYEGGSILVEAKNAAGEVLSSGVWAIVAGEPEVEKDAFEGTWTQTTSATNHFTFDGVGNGTFENGSLTITFTYTVDANGKLTFANQTNTDVFEFKGASINASNQLVVNVEQDYEDYTWTFTHN